MHRSFSHFSLSSRSPASSRSSKPSVARGSNRLDRCDNNISPDDQQDIRLSSPIRFRRSSWTNIVRVFLLVTVDLAALKLSAFTLDWADRWSDLLYLGGMSTGNLIFEVSTLALIALGGGYRPGISQQCYGRFVWAILISSFLSLPSSFHEGFASQGWREVSLMLLLSAACIWKASVLYVGRRLVLQVVALLRHQKIACYSALIIAEPWNQSDIQALVEKQGRYEVVGIESSASLDYSNRAELLEHIIDEDIDEVFIDWSSIERRLFLLQYLRASKAIIRLLPNGANLELSKLELLNIDTLTHYTLPSESAFFSRFSIKRLFDFIAAAIAIILLSPLLLTVALLIRLDSPGPILYQQIRVGLKGQEFKVWKFRSMVVDAEKMQSKLERMNETGDGVLFKIKKDPRITRVGHFIRRYSIDELPQLFNVLCGQMSLVGPRPLPVRDVQRFSRESFFIRNEVLPGITGLWQVSGRSDIKDFEQAFHLDMDYIENWSLTLDFQILLKTFSVVLFSKGAY